MKHWLRFVLLLNTVGGGFTGIVGLLPPWSQAHGDAAMLVLILGMNLLFCLGIYAGWRLYLGDVRGLNWVRFYLVLQLPYLSSPIFGYQLISALGFRVSLGVLTTSQVTLTTEPFLGSVNWVSIAQGAPFGIGLNLVALALLLLVNRNRAQVGVPSAPAA